MQKDDIFNKCCWYNWQLSCRRMWIDPFLSTCTKVTFKWIKELHIKPETLILIEEKVGKTLEDMGTVEQFLNRTAIACAVRLRIYKWDLIKLQSFCKAKDTVNKTKKPRTDWERIFTYPKSSKGVGGCLPTSGPTRAQKDECRRSAGFLLFPFLYSLEL